MLIDKTPLKSKKFVAYILANIFIVGLLVTALITQPFGWSMSAFMCIGITAIAVISIGYILSQKAVDSFLAGIQKAFPKSNKDDPEEKL